MKKITELTINDFLYVIPWEEVERTLGKRESKHFDNFMRGQTVQSLEAQAGVYRGDLEEFLRYRKKGFSGKNMPLDD
jgi:hypothetical protein